MPALPLPSSHAVTCSNVVQDFTRRPPGEDDVQALWEGVPRADGTPRYITDLLADPANALVTFGDGNSATFASTMNDKAQSQPITRQVSSAPGTICQ